MKFKNKSTWLKNRGYLHLTKQIDVNAERGEILGKVNNPEFVFKHCFFPLIHTEIVERRYKRIDKAQSERAHSFKGKSNSKKRPLHYATHIDSMIFGYYGEILQDKYLKVLSDKIGLADCVTAYRRVEDPSKKGKYKSTIHFAHEVFEEINKRSINNCCVLKFDIEKFFSSMDHSILKKAWKNLMSVDTLSPDHYNVFKAATRFSFILKNDLRINPSKRGKKSGFDEKRLAEIRQNNISAFFENPKELRNEIKVGRLKVYKNQFRNNLDQTIGIPQGLPISATLANLYLLKFDENIFDEVVIKSNGFYRRYSDDIIVICDYTQKEEIKNFVIQTILDSAVTISSEKTEEFRYSRNYRRMVLHEQPGV
ncbi:hypothetical protein ABIB62_000746 [Mucilaginibacter sp. UYP25]|uniref:reverse transcriptase domain-containing protein n=1 Tax=unclassified Mucilaginibacter TaxID=2617802 RepID=UPI003398B0EA